MNTTLSGAPGVRPATATEFGEGEKEEARLIQQSLLPSASLEGATYEVAYKFTPFAEVGGDFADFFTLMDGRVGVYVGDIVGKGLAAAMYAALAMGTLRGIHKSGVEAAAVLTMFNKRLHVRPVAARYCAALYATFEPASLKLTLSNAGLPLPLIASKGGCREFGEGGMPSGMFDDVDYAQSTIQLFPGDSVLFATDGLHELRNHREEFISAEQLSALWRECGKKSANESLDLLFDGVRGFSEGAHLYDDLTAVVLKVPEQNEK
ncbi:MAG: SpoIIE family protein phosphatase [Candidatus Acidiferrales bacterium]